MSDTVAHEPLEGAAETAVSGGNRRLLMLVAGGAAVLVLGLAVYFLFLSGGDEPAEPSSAPAPSSQPADGKDKGGKDKDKGDTTVPKEVDVDFAVGRDPFQPLAVEAIVEPPAEPTDTGTTGTTGTTDPVTTPDPTVTPQPTPTVEPVTIYRVKLLSVDLVKEKATIVVDGKRYKLAVKDMFPSTKTGPFQLTAVGELKSGTDTATVVFGADAPVELVRHEPVTFEN